MIPALHTHFPARQVYGAVLRLDIQGWTLKMIQC